MYPVYDGHAHSGTENNQAVHGEARSQIVGGVWDEGSIPSTGNNFLQS